MLKDILILWATVIAAALACIVLLKMIKAKGSCSVGPEDLKGAVSISVAVVIAVVLWVRL